MHLYSVFDVVSLMYSVMWSCVFLWGGYGIVSCCVGVGWGWRDVCMYAYVMYHNTVNVLHP